MPLPSPERRKALRDGIDARGEKAVGAADHRIARAGSVGTRKMRRGEHGRHGRIAAEADDGARASSGRSASARPDVPAASASSGRARATREPPRRRGGGDDMDGAGGKIAAVFAPRAIGDEFDGDSRARQVRVASASAGNRWPPVPPAATRIGARVMRSALPANVWREDRRPSAGRLRVTRDQQAHAERERDRATSRHRR